MGYARRIHPLRCGRVSGRSPVLALAFVFCCSGCGTVRISERPVPVLYEDQPASILNTNLVSPESRQVLRDLNERKPGVRTSAPEARIAIAEARIRAARDAARRYPERALAGYIEACRAVWGPEILDPSGERTLRMRNLYNHACGQAAVLVHRSQRGLEGPVQLAGPSGDVEFEVRRTGSEIVDPALWVDVENADGVRMKGLHKRTVQEGLGGMLAYKILIKDPDRFERPEGTLRGLPATAILSFAEGGRRAVLTCYDVLAEDDMMVGERQVKLAADFSLPLAATLATAPGLGVGILGMLRPVNYLDRTDLYPYAIPRDDRIPVIMTHGLMSVPSAFGQMLNGLLADEEIRERYQFWLYRYPSGIPLGYSAAGLRNRMQEFRAALGAGGSTPDLDRFVLIGHSMGGLISSVQIRKYDATVMKKLTRTRLYQLLRDEGSAEKVQALMELEPLPFVERVVFISTPHRGSPFALKPVARFGASLIRLPMDLLMAQPLPFLDAATDLGRSLWGGDLNCINMLQSDSPALILLNALPCGEGVTCHSIMGNRGKRVPVEKSSDGVVPYWSSHIDWAVSEKIVPSGHDAQMHPDAIEEVRRILHEHLRETE